MNRLTNALCVIGMTCLFHGQACARDIPALERHSLARLTGVQVAVSMSWDPPAYSAVADSAGLVTKIELALRRAGIRVYGDTEVAQGNLGFVTLEVISLATSTSSEEPKAPLAYGIALRLSVGQYLWQVVNGAPKSMILGETWSRDYILEYGTKTLAEGRLKQQVSDMTDELANDWLAAHGK